MPEVDNFGATKADIERHIEHAVTSLVEGELSVGKISELLGALGAVEAVIRRIADAERRTLQAVATRDTLGIRLRDADASERALLSERMNELQRQIDQFQATRFDLSARLETLSKALRA